MPVTNIDITDVDHEARITANEDSITSLNSSISSLSSAVNNPTTGLSALNTTVSGHTTSIGTINTTLSSHTSSIDGLLIDVAQNTSDIGALQSDLNTLETTVSGHTTSIGTLTSDVSTLNSTVSGHTTAISGITTDISNIQTSLENVSLNTTGFENQVDSTYTFDEGTRTFTIQPATTNYNIFQDSVKSSITTSKSITIPDVTSPYFIYLDNTNTLQYLSSFDITLIENKVYVAVIYWNAVQGKALFVGNERHEASMSWATHYYLHTYEGSRYQSGFALSGFSIDGDGSSNTHSQFVADAGVFSDEDIIHNMIASPQIPILYRIGTEWRRKTPDNYPFIGNGQEGFTGTGRICYNELVTGSYQLTEVSNNHHVLIHLLATNDINYPVIGILGINEYSPVADARAGANTEISSLTGLPFAEFVLIGTVILQTSNSYTNTYKVRTVSTDLGENYVDFRTSTVLNISSGAGDHSLLSNLDKDTHLQYLTNGRGDARYGSLTQTNTNTSDISALSATVGGITTSIGTINITLTSLDGRVTALEGASLPLHASTHQNGGADELALDASQITTGNLTLARNTTLTRGGFLTSDNGSTIVERTMTGVGIKRVLGVYPAVGGNTLNYMTLGDLIIAQREYWLYEDFTGATTAGQNNWVAVASGGGAGVSIATQPLQDDRRHGVMTLSTGSGASGRCTYHNGLTNFIYGANGALYFDMICYVPILSTATQEYTLELGLGDNTGAVADQTNGIYFKYDRTISNNWIIVSSAGGVRTSTITSIPVQATNWSYLRMVIDTTTDIVTFYVDTTTAGSINTNLPVLTTAIMGNLFKIRKTAGATARLFHIDSVYQWHYRTNSLSWGA